MADSPLFALTGATGFAGRVLLDSLLNKGARVRALVRRRAADLPSSDGVEWVAGDLASGPVLEALVSGADVVVHLAGATKASDPSTFRKVNAEGTAAIVRVAGAAQVGRFIHVSSLTALRPNVSAYAQSKAESETLATANRGAMPLFIVRAPAILGPGDEATASLFSGLARGILPVPGGRAAEYRFSVLDVADAAAFILTLADSPADGVRVIAPASHRSLGWSDIAESASRVLKRPVRQIRLAPPLLAGAGHIADFAAAMTRRPQVFSSAKVRELLSGDWIAETQVSQPTPLDDTLARCLAPFLASDR